MTGTALIPLAANVFATAFTSNSGPTVMTWGDITSLAFIMIILFLKEQVSDNVRWSVGMLASSLIIPRV